MLNFAAKSKIELRKIMQGGIVVKRVLIIGAGKDGMASLRWLKKNNKAEIVAVIDENMDAPGISLAKSYNIPVSDQWKEWMQVGIDFVIEATGDFEQFDKIKKHIKSSPPVIPANAVFVFGDFVDEQANILKRVQDFAKHQELLLEHMQEGFIVIDINAIVTYLNHRAENILKATRQKAVGLPIEEITSQVQLPRVLRSRKKETNQKVVLENGRRIIVDLVPVMDKRGYLKGAFAIFRDITEVIELAEQVSGLREVEKILEAIFQSSNEAISVVDEQGRGVMVNHAYTELTGMDEKEIIDQPASADIAIGESIHTAVLKTRKLVRSARMRVGKFNKEVIVNAAPIIVDGKLKGSVGVFHDVTELSALTAELSRAKQTVRNLEANYTFEDIIGNSSEIKLPIEQSKVSAQTASTVLLRGEYGTGKEMFAQAIHNASNRKYYKFIHVNCAVSDENALAKQLFGEMDRASGGRKGVFEQADNGTVFLDEIGELSLNIQKKLLHVLQHKEVERLEAKKRILVNVRVIASTNTNLERAVGNGKFMEELYYHLSKLPIHIPSLRERKPDIELLANHILNKISQEYGKSLKILNAEALEYIKRYDWPRNIRELENVLARAVISMENREEVIQRKHLPELYPLLKSLPPVTLPSEEKLQRYTLQTAVEEVEIKMIKLALENAGWNKKQAANNLDISIRNLYYKMKKYQLEES